MADISFLGANVDVSANGSTFFDWITLTNQLAYAMGTTVVTVSSNSVGASTSGNAFITGILSANTLAADTMRGGTVETSANLTITSNVAMTGNASVNSHLTVGAKITANGISVSANGVETSANLVINPIGGGISVSNSVISDVGDPVDPSDAVNLGYLLALGSTYENKAAVETNSPVVDVISIAGYYQSGDGGQAIYMKVAVEPSHSLKINDSAGNWWEIADSGTINVLQAGAKNTGSTSDAATNLTAFNNCRDYLNSKYSGGRIFVPRGTYYLSAQFQNTNDGISLVGENWENTILDFSQALSGNGINWSCNTATIADLLVTGANNANFAILNSNHINISRVISTNCRGSNTEFAVSNTNFSSIDVVECRGGATFSGRNMYINGNTSHLSLKSYVGKQALHGLRILNVKNFSGEDITIKDSSSTGVYASNVSSWSVNNIEVSNCVSHGIQITSPASQTSRVAISNYFANKNGTTSGSNALRLEANTGTIFCDIRNSYDSLPTSGTTTSTSNTGSGTVNYTENNVEFAGTHSLEASSGLLHVREEQPNGTNGGDSTSGSWTTRVLNTTMTNELNGASLSSNRITLPAGTYDIEASAPAKRAQDHKIKLRNITDSSDILIGQNVNSGSDDSSTDCVPAPLVGRFTLAATKSLEIQHRVQATKLTDGLGAAASFGVVEVYTDVRIWKVS